MSVITQAGRTGKRSRATPAAPATGADPSSRPAPVAGTAASTSAASPASTAPASTPGAALPAPGDLRWIAPGELRPNPFQPRREFDPAALEELAGSIAIHGILQPISVRNAKDGQGFELIAGERRLRAARRLGLASVPCVVSEVPDDRLLELALIENLQRRDLDPLEVATSYRALMDRCGYTQDEVAKRLSVGRSSVANALRLLELPGSLQGEVTSGRISAGHARAIAALPGEGEQRGLAERVAREALTVRETEAEVARLKSGARKGCSGNAMRPAYLDQLEMRLRRTLGTKVSIQETGPARGRIVIEFYGEDDFERILGRLETGR